MRYLIIVFLFLISCKSNSIIINSNENYYSETNIYKTSNNKTELSQRVRLNNTKNGLHSSWHYLNIEIKNINNIKSKKLNIHRDTIFIKVNYEFSSQRSWGENSKSINGSIKIIEIKENSIKVKENLVVINDSNKKIEFKGIITFQRNGNMEVYPEMLEN